MSDHLVVPAPAKINLTLDILGKRSDGYHALRSAMQALDLHDTLELRRAPELRFTCAAPDLAGDDNLVPRAARLLRAETGYDGGAEIMLRKAIPVDAGLGGGSSDAAAALRGLNALWDLRLPAQRLAELGAALGSDVPFFLSGPAALVGGRGEVVDPLPGVPRAHVVLHRPPFGISTGRVFGALSPEHYGDGTATERLLAALRQGLEPEQWPLSNGLQETVIALYPGIAAALQRLRGAGAAQPMLTGSGSTIFALFSKEEAARAVYRRLIADGHHAILTRSKESLNTSVR